MTDIIKKYKKLEQREHILTRPSMYIGSVENEPAVKYVVNNGRFEETQLEYNPALLKLFDEILINAVDEAVTGNVKKITVNYSEIDGEISISDDGGIPVVKHPTHDQYVPEMIFGEFMAGSNFGDERQGGGMNGLGAKLVVVYSRRFTVETSDGKNKFVQVFTDNMKHRSDATVTASSSKGTTISYIPDYERFGVDMYVDCPDYKMMEKRVYDVAACNPNVKIVFCGKEVKFKSFEQYAKMYCDPVVSDLQGNFKVCVGTSNNDSFSSVSFVNNIDTYNGGTHIDYVVSQLVTEIREDIKKRFKIDVKPNNIKQQMSVFVSCNINSPMFTSQTKEYLSTPPKAYGVEYVPSKAFIKKILASEIVESVVAWAEGERKRQDEAELKKIDKAASTSSSLKRIVKFEDAGSYNREECTLILCEGDSAKKPLISARDSTVQGVYPLQGKPLNVRNVSISKLASNKEFSELVQILGVSASKRNKIDNIRYGKILIAADFDLDGCLTGDTPIPLLDGRVVPIQELENEKEFWVYSYTEDGIPVAGRGHSARITRDVTTLLEITLDNGEVVRCTHNHPFMKRNGKFVRADELFVGDSLMPHCTERNNKMWNDSEQAYDEAAKFFADFNHSIISIKEVVLSEPVPVWDITVDEYHNFALAQGCVVHNSHICGLVINMLHAFWPDLLTKGFLYRLKSPLIITKVGKQVYEFFNKDDYMKWAETAPKHSYKYYKGLSSFNTKELAKYLGDTKYWVPIEYDDGCEDSLSLVFDKDRANDRKQWLETGVECNEDI